MPNLVLCLCDTFNVAGIHWSETLFWSTLIISVYSPNHMNYMYYYTAEK